VVFVAGDIPKKVNRYMRILIGAILFIFIPGVAVAFYQSVLSIINYTYWSLALGISLGCAIDYFFLRRIPGFSTFEHELTHALVALLFLKRITGFTATRWSGGFVEYSGGYGGKIAEHIIGLAPYSIPTLAVIMTLIRPWVQPTWYMWFDIGLGFTRKKALYRIA